MNKEEIKELQEYNLEYMEAILSEDIFGGDYTSSVKLEYANKTIEKLQQALIDIREYVYQNEYCRFGHIDGSEADEIYKIIDKVLGGSDE